MIVGARTEAQLADDLAAADLKLSEEEVSAARRCQRSRRLRYPYWHQAGDIADRLGPADRSLLGRYVK